MNIPDPGPNGHRPGLSSLNALGRTGWLSEQPREFQRTMASLGRWVVLQKGTRLYSYDDTSDAMYGLDRGAIDFAIPLSPEEECTFYRGTPGFWWGDGGLLDGTSRNLSSETVTECRLLRVPHSALRRHLAEHPADWACLYDLAVKRGLMTAGLLGEQLGLPPRARIARLLIRLAARDGMVASNQEELGKLARMSRATFRRSMSNLIASGAVETQYGSLRIVDRAAIQREADAPNDMG